MNRTAQEMLAGRCEMEIIPGAAHLFENR